MLSNEILTDYCDMSADLFVRSAEQGYDSEEFINRLMHSELGKQLYPGDSAEDIIRQAPMDMLRKSYAGLHVMSFEDAIKNIKEMAA